MEVMAISHPKTIQVGAHPFGFSKTETDRKTEKMTPALSWRCKTWLK
jgi:hypothetical protein